MNKYKEMLIETENSKGKKKVILEKRDRYREGRREDNIKRSKNVNTNWKRLTKKEG